MCGGIFIGDFRQEYSYWFFDSQCSSKQNTENDKLNKLNKVSLYTTYTHKTQEKDLYQDNRPYLGISPFVVSYRVYDVTVFIEHSIK